jgi:hypothetical protein
MPGIMLWHEGQTIDPEFDDDGDFAIEFLRHQVACTGVIEPHPDGSRSRRDRTILVVPPELNEAERSARDFVTHYQTMQQQAQTARDKAEEFVAHQRAARRVYDYPRAAETAFRSWWDYLGPGTWPLKRGEARVWLDKVMINASDADQWTSEQASQLREIWRDDDLELVVYQQHNSIHIDVL